MISRAELAAIGPRAELKRRYLAVRNIYAGGTLARFYAGPVEAAPI